MNARRFLFIVVLLALLTVGCADNDEPQQAQIPPEQTTAVQQSLDTAATSNALAQTAVAQSGAAGEALLATVQAEATLSQSGSDAAKATVDAYATVVIATLQAQATALSVPLPTVLPTPVPGTPAAGTPAAQTPSGGFPLPGDTLVWVLDDQVPELLANSIMDDPRFEGWEVVWATSCSSFLGLDGNPSAAIFDFQVQGGVNGPTCFVGYNIAHPGTVNLAVASVPTWYHGYRRRLR